MCYSHLRSRGDERSTIVEQPHPITVLASPKGTSQMVAGPDSSGAPPRSPGGMVSSGKE